jgi:hypothetical protein
MDQVSQNPGHPFSAIPLLNNKALLARLKPLVTTDPVGQILKATGVPPTIEIAQNSKKVLALCIKTQEGVQAMGETVKDTVFQAFELRAIKNRQMATQQMKDMLYKASRRFKLFCYSKLRRFGMPFLWSLVKMISSMLLLMMATVMPFLLMGWMTKLGNKLGAPGRKHMAAKCGKLQKLSNFQKSRALSAMAGRCGLLDYLDMR